MASATIKRFGTAFNVEYRHLLCSVRVLDGLSVYDLDPLPLRDALIRTQFILGEYAEDGPELGACMADIRRSGYGTVAGVNVRFIPHYGV